MTERNKPNFVVLPKVCLFGILNFGHWYLFEICVLVLGNLLTPLIRLRSFNALI